MCKPNSHLEACNKAGKCQPECPVYPWKYCGALFPHLPHDRCLGATDVVFQFGGTPRVL